MATVIEGGADLFDALAFGRPQAGIYDFLAQRAQSYSQNLNSAGQMFIQNVKTYYDAVTESEAVRLARMAAKKVGSLWQTDSIRPLMELAEFQNAMPKMQRWVMACPEVRQLYHNQQCEGYEGTYVDVEPGLRGEAHYDYRRVMNGIVDETDAGWYACTYIEDLRNGDTELTLGEQDDILYTWQRVKYHLNRRADDPTSRWGAKF